MLVTSKGLMVLYTPLVYLTKKKSVGVIYKLCLMTWTPYTDSVLSIASLVLTINWGKIFLALSYLKLFNYCLIFANIYLVTKSLLPFIELNILFSDCFAPCNAFYKTCFQAFQVFATPNLMNILAQSIDKVISATNLILPCIMDTRDHSIFIYHLKLFR